MSEVRTDWQTGQPIPSADMRANSQALAGLVQTGQDATRPAGGALRNDARYVVKITAVNQVDGLFSYEFEQVRWDTASSDWVAAANPITHAILGEIVAQGNKPSSAAIDDIVTIRPGGQIDDQGRVQWEYVSVQSWFHAKVTASSGSDPDHTVTEVDANGNTLTGGRTPTDAEALNGRKGVPVDTFVIVFDLGPTAADGEPVYKFLIPDGLTDSPRDLIADGLTSDTTAWDIEQDSEPVQSNSGRVWFGTPIMAFFWREKIHDASGMETNESAESRFRLIADLDDNSYSNAIALVADGVDGAYIKHNEPQANHTEITLELISSDGSVTITPSNDADTISQGGDADWNKDRGGHNTNGDKTYTFDLAASGGSSSPDGADDLVVNEWITVDDSITPANEPITVGDDDWRGRVVNVTIYRVTSASIATANSTAFWTRSQNEERVGSTATGKRVIAGGGGISVYVDGDDSGKLKIERSGGVSSPGSQIHLLARGSGALSTTTAGRTISDGGGW